MHSTFPVDLLICIARVAGLQLHSDMVILNIFLTKIIVRQIRTLRHVGSLYFAG